jgi:hypothetical protein
MPLGPGNNSASNRNEYRTHQKQFMFLGSEVRPAPVEAYPKVGSGKAATDRKMWDMQTSDVIIPELCRLR